jgi:hypothetical protein
MSRSSTMMEIKGLYKLVPRAKYELCMLNGFLRYCLLNVTLKQGQGHPQEIPHQVFPRAVICENFRCTAGMVLEIQRDNRKSSEKGE